MDVKLPAGRYIVAVSGGVDSVALLHALHAQPTVQLIVAHFDHGIRHDSAEDRRFVQQLARDYNLQFVFDRAELSPDASEAVARKARYEFLRKAQTAANAQAIITAHHQDDVLETAVMNLLRGTGRKGLSSLTTGEGIIRPLLHVPKSELIDYARRHRLQWREDSTNSNTNFARNRIRHVVLPQWSQHDKHRLLEIIDRMQAVNGELDRIVEDNLGTELSRKWFALLPHAVAREVMATWLRQQNVREFDRRTLERLTVAGKVSEPGKAVDIVKGQRLHFTKHTMSLIPAWQGTSL